MRESAGRREGRSGCLQGAAFRPTAKKECISDENRKGLFMKDQPGEANRAGSSGLGREGKYLTFSLGDEEYGIGILKVKEIIGIDEDYAGAADT